MMKDDDFKLLKGFALRRTDERTNERTFAIVESLSRLKKFIDIIHSRMVITGIVVVVCVMIIISVCNYI